MDKRLLLLNDREDHYLYMTALNSPVLVSIKNNFIGTQKNYPLLNRMVKEFYEMIDPLIIIKSHQINSREGLNYLLEVDSDAALLKHQLIELEKHPLGRLVDLDVYENLKPISRTELGYPKQTCLLCQKDARICQRLNTHSKDDLESKYNRMLIGYYFFKDHSLMINQVMKQELDLPYKFGLVTPYTNGSHPDMNYDLMMQSITFLKDKLAFFFDLGYNNKSIMDARHYGAQLEQDLFKHTGGINTYKGIIFSIGIIAFSYGQYRFNKLDDFNKLQTLIAQSAKQLETKLDQSTFGNKLYATKHIKSIKYHALEGYQLAFDHINDKLDTSDDLHHLLVVLMQQLDDTTTIKRCNMSGLKANQELAKEIIKRGSSYTKQGMDLIKASEKKAIHNNSTIGGCADYLIIILYLKKLKEWDNENSYCSIE